METPSRRLEATRTQGASGFTMVEVLIVVVLGAVILSAAFQLLMGNQRMYTVAAAKSGQMNALRAGTDAPIFLAASSA